MSKIIVADKDDTTRGLLEQSFIRDGHDVVNAPDGNEALAHLQQNQFDLAVLDNSMPVKSTSDVLTKLKEMEVTLPPIIILSTKVKSELAKGCVEVGAKDFVIKPFNLPQLVDRAYKLLKILSKTGKASSRSLSSRARGADQTLNRTRKMSPSWIS